MNLIPSPTSVEKLKEHVKDLHAFSQLVDYEQRLVDNNLHTRALVIVCDGDVHSYINNIEGISYKNWYRVPHTADLKKLPDEYFDIILWSNCTAESIRIPTIHSKLKTGGRMYINNISAILKNCLGTDLSVKSYPRLLAIPNYSVQILSSSGKTYIIFVKKVIFADTELAKELDLIDQETHKLLELKKIKKIIPPILLPGLKNVGGFSCFMDSVLFSILLPHGGYFEKHLLQKVLTDSDANKCLQLCDFIDSKEDCLAYLQKFQKTLQTLAKIIRGPLQPKLTCIPIMHYMKKCNEQIKDLMSGEQQDDSEFLVSLMQIFDINPTRIIHTRRFGDNGTDWPKTINKEESTSILEVRIPESYTEEIELVSWYQRVITLDFENLPIEEWPRKDEIRYRYTQEQEVIVDSDALIFHIPRRQTKFVKGKLFYVKNTAPVNFKEYIQQGSKIFTLNTVTIHTGSAHGGHYTAYFKYGNQWFYYDDLAPPKSRVSHVKWSEVLEEGSTNGSIFIYY